MHFFDFKFMSKMLDRIELKQYFPEAKGWKIVDVGRDFVDTEETDYKNGFTLCCA